MRRPTHRITVTEAARNFADIVNRAFYRSETTILMKNGVAVAHIAPVAPGGVAASEALARWRAIEHLNPADAAAMLKDIDASRARLPLPRLNKLWE